MCHSHIESATGKGKSCNEQSIIASAKLYKTLLQCMKDVKKIISHL